MPTGTLPQLIDQLAELVTAETQLTFTCSKSAIKALKKGVKYVQS